MALESRLADLLHRLYAGIAEVADGATIVDTSKGPAYAVALSSFESVDLRAIHLVRDSRGVAYSWCKEVPRPYTADRVFKMYRLSALASARWIAHHSVMELLTRRAPVTRLRYETFMEDPQRGLLRVLGDLEQNVPSSALAFVGDGSVQLQPAHVVAGNPMRMATGALPIQVDAAWRRDFPRLQQALVTGMTWPMLVRYGYRP
jgi:hypothetical protein